MNLYIYDGPVKEFDRIVTRRWQGRTMAVSSKKARSNLTYQYKQEHGRMPGSRINLPGELRIIDMEGWTHDG